MKKRFFRLSALILALFFVLCLAACGSNSGTRSETGLTRAEEERIIELARAFRIYGDFDADKEFPITQYEYMVYSLCSPVLPESTVKGYGVISLEEADRMFKAAVGDYTIPNLRRTAFEPNEIQVIYYIGENYYVLRTDDSSYDYSVIRSKVLTDDSGARTGVSAAVRVTGSEGSVDIVFELTDGGEDLFRVRKCQIQNGI